jgi:hypothetical protein
MSFLFAHSDNPCVKCYAFDFLACVLLGTILECILLELHTGIVKQVNNDDKIIVPTEQTQATNSSRESR